MLEILLLVQYYLEVYTKEKNSRTGMIHRFWIDSEIFRMHRDSSGIDSEPRFLQQIALWSSFYLHTQMLMKKSAKERLCDRLSL